MTFYWLFVAPWKKKKMVLASAWNEKQSRVSVIKNARDADWLTGWRQTGIQLHKQLPGNARACVCLGKLTWMHPNPQETRGRLESIETEQLTDLEWQEQRRHTNIQKPRRRRRHARKQDTF